MQNIYCIAGKSGTGKSTLVDLLEKKGLKAVQSYTTRKPRYEGEKGHTFITDEEFDALTDICAYTEFDNNRYCVTADMIDENDLFIVDVEGIKYLKEHYHGKKGIVVIGLFCNKTVLRQRMLERGDSEEQVEQRLIHDEKVFKELEDLCDGLWTVYTSPEILAKNVYSYIMRREEKDTAAEPVEELKLTDEQVKRNNDIDNAVYDALLTLLEKSQNNLPWNTELISDITRAIADICETFGYHIRRPYVITEPDGTQHYEE